MVSMVKVVAGLAGAVGGVAALRVVGARHRALEAVAAELRHPLLYVPVSLSTPLLWLARRAPARPGLLVDGTTVERITVPGRDGAASVEVFVYRPVDLDSPAGALLWVHGGGFVMGDAVSYHELCSRFARDLGAVVASVNYRLAPEHPFPAALDDCWSALRWLHEHADELGVDAGRVAVGGDSAGGGLAAALAQLATDQAVAPVAFQVLVYPMLDDRTVLRADHAGTGRFVWSPRSNRFGWTAYLGHRPSQEPPPPFAAGARRENLAGLPPAWVGVGDLDLFHAENLNYAHRLTEAGVACEVHVEPGMYHGADTLMLTRSAQMRRFRDRMVEALRPHIGQLVST